MKQRFLTVLLTLICCTGLFALDRGKGRFTFTGQAPFDQRPIPVFYYIPEQGDLDKIPIFFVFHGADRGIDYLMKMWGVEAAKQKFMVFIPQFSKEDFPVSDYQEIGAMDNDHLQVLPETDLTASLIDRMFEHVRQQLGTDHCHYRIYGHSAGGQFVQRFMLLHQSPYVDRAIIGSPGWYTFPDTAQIYPYGLQNIPYVTEQRLKAYFDQDIVLQLAEADTIRESFLRKTPEAELQGRQRLERGHSFFEFSRRLCAQRGWPFRWRKVVVPNVNHNSVAMGQAAIPLLLAPKSQDVEAKPFDSIVEQCQQLALDNPNVAQCSSIGLTSQGHSIPQLTLRQGEGERLKVWITGALHGNEPAGTSAVLQLAHEILQGTDSILLRQLEFCLLPVCNPDGYIASTRPSSQGLDLNRDMTKMADSLTWILKRAYIDYMPDVAIDVHEYRPLKKQFEQICGEPLEVLSDMLLLPSGHPNIDPDLSQYVSQQLMPGLRQHLITRGFTTGQYFTTEQRQGQIVAKLNGKSPQSSSTWCALSNAVSLFFEIRGIGLGRDLYAKRVECGLTALQYVLVQIAQHPAEVHRLVQSAVHRAISAAAPIVVEAEAPCQLYNHDFDNPQTGVVSTIALPTYDALQQEPTLVRPRPRYYYLLSDQIDAVNRLRAMGIEVTQLRRARRLSVEQFRVTDRQEAALWETIRPLHLKTVTEPVRRKLSKGTYVISTAQRQGNLIVSLLEPESLNSFFSFRVLPASSDTLCLFRQL